MDIVIVDDEPLARQRLARMVEKLEHQVVAQADSAQAALEAIATFDPDVVLLDIRMPGEDGIEAARKISALDDPPAVIFCTAFDQYALDRSEEHTSELQSRGHLVCRLLLEKKKKRENNGQANHVRNGT